VKYRSIISNRYSAESDSTLVEGEGIDQHPGQRLAVLLGAAKAGNVEANLKEFTNILDALQLKKSEYKALLRRFAAHKK
jgi:hypothetical protein